MKRLVWFRNDLRLLDNPALYHSTRNQHDPVSACYIFCREYIARHCLGSPKLGFIEQNLLALEKKLRAVGIPFAVLAVERAQDIAPAILKLCEQEGIQQLAYNAEYPLDETNRDREVTRLLQSSAIEVNRYHDRVIVPPGMLKNGKGDMYRVFTPFMKQWLDKVAGTPFSVYPAPEPRPGRVPGDSGHKIKAIFACTKRTDLSAFWPAGEDAALERLQTFTSEALGDYKNNRDLPAVAGTSGLSPYLAIGVISPKQCFLAATGRSHWQENESVRTWINELGWREFYTHIIASFPRLSRHQPMQTHTRDFPWQYDKALFYRWCEGTTGIPIVDAAMRQLNTTGWMHNRLRMITAMFLTKNLRIHWRWGEDYFMQQLIDADFAANNGGWQWCASTGTDAAPYFRIMNPVSQSIKFDPEGEFIRRFVPELATLDSKTIHHPEGFNDYPAPIVDLKQSRRETIALFQQLGSSREAS